MKISDYFTVSVKCPKCGRSKHMKLSDTPGYTFQCLSCDEDFYSMEIHSTDSDFYDKNEGKTHNLFQITLKGFPLARYREKKNTIRRLAKLYNADFTGYDDLCECLDFGWEHLPSGSRIQTLAKALIALLPKGTNPEDATEMFEVKFPGFGAFVVEKTSDPDHPGAYMAFRPDGQDYEKDLVLVEGVKDSDSGSEPGDINIFLWENAGTEDVTCKKTVSSKEIKETLEEAG